MTDVLGVAGMEPEAFKSLLKFVYFGNVVCIFILFFPFELKKKIRF